MISDNTVNKIVKFLNLHSSNFHQYKDALFNIFLESYKKGECDSIETVRDVIYNKINQTDASIKDRVMSEFTSMWDEWKYFIDNGLQRNFITLSP